MDCSKCSEPSERSILVHNKGEPEPKPDEKDRRGVRIIRFCKGHWLEIEKLLPPQG